MKFQILKKEDNFIINNDIIAEKVIIATGGATFPKNRFNWRWILSDR